MTTLQHRPDDYIRSRESVALAPNAWEAPEITLLRRKLTPI